MTMFCARSPIGDHNQSSFSPLSAEEYGDVNKTAGDCTRTPKKPTNVPPSKSMGQISPSLGRMVNHLLSSPEQSTGLIRKGYKDCKDQLTGEFNKLTVSCYLNPTATCSIPENLNNFSGLVDNTHGLFSSGKYYQAFGPESGIDWNIEGWEDMRITVQCNNQRNNESSCFVSSDGSSLSTSLSSSNSISALYELSEQVPEKDAVASLGNIYSRPDDERCKAPCIENCGLQRRNELVNGKIRTKRIRNRQQRCSVHGNSSGQHGISDAKLSMSNFTGKAPNTETTVAGGGLMKVLSKNRKSVQKRGIRRRSPFEMFAKPNRVVTLRDAQNILMAKEKLFFQFVTDHVGSRFLQKQLESATSEQLWSTFAHLKPHFVEVCQDIFGNYVAQKYLELGSDKLRSEIVNTLQPSISSLSKGVYGCRVVQKLLECMSWEHKQIVKQQLAGSIIILVYDQNGNHVVQKMIQCFCAREVVFVVKEITGYTYTLAKHPYGSRVIQRLLEKVSRKVALPLLMEIKQHTVALSKDKYGNYIIQWIIKHCALERKAVVLELIGRVAELSREKFASNVIEQAIKSSCQTSLRYLAEELLNDGRSPTLALLVNDQFGNFVIQTLLDSSSGVLRQKLLCSLSKCKKVNKDYGKRLLVKVGQMSRKSNIDIE